MRAGEEVDAAGADGEKLKAPGAPVPAVVPAVADKEKLAGDGGFGSPSVDP